MEDYYLKGEEKFGLFTSFLYSIGVKSRQIRAFYNFVVDDLEKTKFTELLDVGTGPGYIPAMLIGAGRLKKIYAIDPSKEMINLAKSRTKGYKVVFDQGSSRNVPFKNKFDIIISTLSFHHWAEKENSLLYLSRFLKKNGEIRIYEFEKEELKGIRRYFVSSHAVSRKEMLEVAKKSKLKIKGILQKDGFIRTAFAK